VNRIIRTTTIAGVVACTAFAALGIVPAFADSTSARPGPGLQRGRLARWTPCKPPLPPRPPSGLPR
jgi:hypothetical protein